MPRQRRATVRVRWGQLCAQLLGLQCATLRSAKADIDDVVDGYHPVRGEIDVDDFGEIA
jgi:hypothetical protein